MPEGASRVSPEGIVFEAIQEGKEPTPVRDQPIVGEAQQLVIDGFFKALEERRR